MGLSTVPVCQPCQKCASMSEGHPEVSVLPWTFSRGPRCPEGQDIVPLCQMAQISQDCTYGSDLFVMMIFDCFLSHVMAIGLCVSPLIVLQSKTLLRLGFVMEDTVYSLCLAFSNCTFMNHTVPDKWKSFYKSKSYLFSISIHFMTSFT